MSFGRESVMRQQAVWGLALMAAAAWAWGVLAQGERAPVAPAAATAARNENPSTTPFSSPTVAGQGREAAEVACTRSPPPAEIGVPPEMQHAFCLRERLIEHALPFESRNGAQPSGPRAPQDRCPQVTTWLAEADDLAHATPCGQLRGRGLSLARRAWFYGCIDFDAFLGYYRVYRQDSGLWQTDNAACSAVPAAALVEMKSVDLTERGLCQYMAVQRFFPALDDRSVAAVSADLDACVATPDTPFPL